jgi:hypothetical protein
VNNPPIARGRVWFRLIALFLGFGILVWLPVEDQSELGVLIASGAICTWIAARLLITAPQEDLQLILRHALVGSGAGLILAPIAIILMAVKSGIHGHGTPDFSVGQMQSVLSRIPFFVLSGFLIGLGSGIFRLAKRNEVKLEV